LIYCYCLIDPTKQKLIYIGSWNSWYV
jgi:hypothetical protein